MNKLLGIFGGAGVNCADLQLGDSIPPTILSKFETGSTSFNASSGYKPDVAVTPDNSRCVCTNGYEVTFFHDINDLSVYQLPSIRPNMGYLCGCATTNDYVAVGGGSGSKLVVYRWSDLGIETLPVSGLGSVSAVAFSHDGEKLAVVHSSAPYLRIYKTSDWTYSDVAGNVGSSKYRVCFTTDDSSIVCGGTSNPRIAVVDAQSYAVLKTYSNMYEHDVSYVYGGIIANPFKPKSVIVWHGGNRSSNYRQLWELDIEADTEVDIWPYPQGNTRNRQVFSCVFDKLANQLLVQINKSYGEHTLQVFEAGTWELATSHQTHFDLFSIGYGNLAIAQANTGRLTGTVRDLNNNPAERIVRVYSRDTGAMLGQTRSDAATGNYSVYLPDNNECDVQFLAEDGEQLNDLFFARAIPESLP